MAGKNRRIETTTSRTAEMTCVSRAASFFEKKPQFKSGDFIAPKLLPGFMVPLVKMGFVRRLFSRKMAPNGIYEYVIARTKYIDSLFEKAVREGFEQALVFGAGFDTRGIRFLQDGTRTKVFELDVPITQNAKINQLKKRGIKIPSSIIFVPIDFNRESPEEKLAEYGFLKNRKTLFLLEGLLMYLDAGAVDTTFGMISEFAGRGSRVIFDFIYSSVLKGEDKYYGESKISSFVSEAGETWTFGLDKNGLDGFLAKYGLSLVEKMTSGDLESRYFSSGDNRVLAKINGTHCIVHAEKQENL